MGTDRFTLLKVLEESVVKEVCHTVAKHKIGWEQQVAIHNNAAFSVLTKMEVEGRMSCSADGGFGPNSLTRIEEFLKVKHILLYMCSDKIYQCWKHHP